MSIFRGKKKNKACVVGLDGVSHSLLLDLTNKGIMPFTARLLEIGKLHRMKASLPEISAVSWTDFMTGENPGTHGIFGFTDLRPDSYELRFPNFLDLKCPTFWDILDRKKKSCIILNQPSTYPARKINGILVSGFVAIELSKAVYPLSLKSKLESLGYRIDIDTMKARENHDYLWSDLSQTLEGRKKAFHMLWKEDWDYFELVITGTDRLHHFLWDACGNESHPHHENFLNYYRQVDSFLEQIFLSFQKAGNPEENLFLLSDHGFTGITQEVYLNTWLEEEGYLKFENSSEKSLSKIRPQSLAFALDPNRIYLNLRGKFPRGNVDRSDSEAVKREITEKLKKIEYQGKKIIRQVFDTSQVYSGPQQKFGPDLIAVSEHGFDLKGSLKKNQVFGRTVLQGMHTWDDAFFWSTEDWGDELKISDIAEIILKVYP